jgi:hypothetical protein
MTYVDIEPRQDPAITYAELFVKPEEIDYVRHYLGRIISEVLDKSIPKKLRIIVQLVQKEMS